MFHVGPLNTMFTDEPRIRIYQNGIMREASVNYVDRGLECLDEKWGGGFLHTPSMIDDSPLLRMYEERDREREKEEKKNTPRTPCTPCTPCIMDVD